MRKWVKLYTKILLDPEMHKLSDGTFRACINLIVLAGIVDRDGELGTAADIAFHLRTDSDVTQEYLIELKKFDFAREKKGVWTLRNWDKLQNKPASDAPEAIKARVKKHRENKPKAAVVTETSNESVTALHDAGNAPRLEEIRVEEKREELTPGADAPKPIPPKSQEPDPVKELATVFEQAAGIKLPQANQKKAKEQVGVLWWNPLREMIGMSNGSAPDLMRQAVAHMRRDHLTINSPRSTLAVFTSLNGERQAVTPAPPKVDPEHLTEEQKQFKAALAAQRAKQHAVNS